MSSKRDLAKQARRYRRERDQQKLLVEMLVKANRILEAQLRRALKAGKKR